MWLAHPAGTIASMDLTDVDTGTPEPAPPPLEPVEPSPPEPPAVPKIPKWPFVVAGILLLLGSAVAAAWPINVPYYAVSPGPVNDTSDFVVVPDVAGPEEGDFFFLTVSLREINAIEYLGAMLSGEVDLTPRENIRPAGVSPEELRRQNLDLMTMSQTNAKYVALTELGYDVTLDGTGALVTSVIEGSAADGLVETEDVIVAVDGDPVEFSQDAVDLIGDRRPGEVVELLVQRIGDGGEVEEHKLQITLGPFRFVDEDGVVQSEPDRGMVGVLLVNAPSTIIFPIDVEIDSQNIGGPSAGLMFTLEIMNQLTVDDLTKGYRIAGTGSIDADGVVGAIGGIRQKVFGAIDVGADYVLVPAGNYDDAVAAAGDAIEVVRIETIDDALSFLEALREKT